MSKPLQILANQKPLQAQLATPASTAKSLGLELKAQATAPLQPKQREASVSDRVFNDTPLGRFNPKETLGKLPTVLKDRAAKLPTSDAAAPLGKAQVGSDLTHRQQSSTAIDQRMKDGAGLGRGDSLGLLDVARKATKDDLLAKPNGSAPAARVGAFQQRDRYSLQGDSFLMTRDEALVHRADQRELARGSMVFAPVPTSAAAKDNLSREARANIETYTQCKEAYTDLSLAQAGVAVVYPPSAPVQGAAALVSQVFARVCEKAAQNSQARLDELSSFEFSGQTPSVKMPNPEEGSANPVLIERLRRWVNPNDRGSAGIPTSPLDSQSPLVQPDPSAEDYARASSKETKTILGIANQGVICPGPEQFKSLVNPNQIDFLAAGFQQKTDALINPSRQEDGSSGGPVLQAPGRAVFGQDGFTSISTDGLSERKLNDVLLSGGTGATGTRSISTDGLSERKVSDFVLNQGAASNGFQAISTDGLSERPVVGFSLGQVPSAAQGFQAISTDGLSERSGAGQVFTAAVQGSLSADPFAATAPTSPVF